MAEDMQGKCGTYCGECEYREKMNCPGCQQAGGTIFWGSCEVAACSIEKEHETCGKCESCPCDLLKSYAHDPEQGDDGERIENLKAWNAEGFENWVKNKQGD